MRLQIGVVLRAPLENASDKFAKRILFGIQCMDLNSVTLDTFTSESLAAYRNSSVMQLLESVPTTIASQPAHRIVYIDKTVEGIKLRSNIKPYTEEFVEIVVNVLDKEGGVDRDIALLIADGVYNRLNSSNVRECVRIARLSRIH